jgi:two-component system response regulator AtoC
MDSADLFRRSEKMRAVEAVVRRVADLPTPVLLRGEGGVGKEQVARALHALSRRASGPFVKVACASLPPDGVEAEVGGKVGAAVGGTLFVDELADMSPDAQGRLVRLIDGAIDVRVIAATSADVYAVVSSGRLRRDLYEHLAVTTIAVPPLRERREEIDFLVRHFLEFFSGTFRRSLPSVSEEMAEALRTYDWPGNVRELQNIVKRWVVLGAEADVREELQLRQAMARRPAVTAGGNALGLREIARRAAREAERQALQEALARANGNRSAAARYLKVSYKTLLQKLEATGLALPKRARLRS